MKISALSLWLQRACWLFVCFVPLGFAFSWYMAISKQSLYEVKLPFKVVYDNIELWQWLAGIALTALPMLALVIALKYLSQLMQEFAQGRYFSLPAIDNLYRFSTWLLASTVLKIVIVPFLSVALTINNPDGERMLVVTIEGDNLYVALIAVVFFVITRILQEGRRIDMENAEFI